MRDNTKGGALTEVTFYIFSLFIRQNTDTPSCNLLKKKQADGFH